MEREGNSKILDHYGIDHQSFKASEELAECIRAVARCRMEQTSLEALDNLREEIADSMVVLDQIMQFYGIEWSEIEAIADSKIDRQLRRIACQSD